MPSMVWSQTGARLGPYGYMACVYARACSREVYPSLELALDSDIVFSSDPLVSLRPHAHGFFPSIRSFVWLPSFSKL